LGLDSKLALNKKYLQINRDFDRKKERMKILLVEDDSFSANALAEILKAHRYTTDIAADAETALDLATAFEYDLVLLDILLPKLDGISLCEQLRQQQNAIPILFLSVKDSKSDIVKGLNAGGDDYIVKPYDVSELIARMQSLLRRGNLPISMVLTWGDLCLNPVTGEVTYSDRKVPFSAKEYSLLELFLKNPQRLFSRSAIIDSVWSLDETPIEKTVTTHIKDIRQKLKAAGCDANVIETVYGLGYRLHSAPKVEREDTQVQEQQIQRQREQALESVAKVIDRFRDSFTEQIASLEKALYELQKSNAVTSSLRREAQREAHKLAGSLKIFGYPKGSQIAREIEHLLLDEKTLGEKEVLQLDKLIYRLKKDLKKLPTPPATEDN
jgi:DNA-binding response OmpR family regulator/HPt (histidine-containing phosphotransfer) domain-containing protein